MAALCLFFFLSYNSMEKTSIIYLSMDEPNLPIVFVEKNGLLINPMHAYIQEMGNNAARDCITMLSDDRKINLRVREYNKMIISATYEIRSMDLTRLVETGRISELRRENGMLEMAVSIDNLIHKGKEYLLRIVIDTGEQNLNYYTRIIWGTKDQSIEMINLALDFTQKTFSKSDARNLTIYMETDDTADNSTLDHVTIHSSFNQITWGDTGMQPEDEFYASLKELNGVMGEVQIQYVSSCIDGDGNIRKFNNEDNYVFRYDPKRIFIMDFDRRTKERFDGAAFRFNGKRMLLGISDMKDYSVKKSSSGQFTAFKANNGLFRYDSSGNRGIMTILSLESQDGDIMRSAYQKNDVKILSVKNNGDIDFILYGYINKGRYEGNVGILYYTYDNSEDTIIEKFFMPTIKDYERLKEDVERLSYVNEKGMLYLYYDGNVNGIDINSLEVVAAASNLNDSKFACSKSGQFIAFLDNAADIFHAEKICFMDLEKEKKLDIWEAGKFLRTLGFIGEDFIYGLAEQNSQDDSEKYTDLYEMPYSEIRIVDSSLQLKTSYGKENMYFGNAFVTGGRIHFNEYIYDGNQYINAGDDSIISNKGEINIELEGINSYQDQLLEKTWYLEIKDIENKEIRHFTPKNLSIEKATPVELKKSADADGEQEFYYYTLGHYRGACRTFQRAYQLSYENFGYIMDGDYRILWNRTDRENSSNIKDPINNIYGILSQLPNLAISLEYEGSLIINAFGLDLSSVLYFVGKGNPVVAYEENGFRLIYAYDSYNISLVNPADGSSQVMGRHDAESYFEERGNKFVGIITL